MEFAKSEKEHIRSLIRLHAAAGDARAAERYRRQLAALPDTVEDLAADAERLSRIKFDLGT